MTFETTEKPHVVHRSQKAASEEQKQYFGVGKRMHENPYLSTQLAQIVKIERDAQNRLTGYATVQLMTMNGLRASALMPITSSQYMFFGGLPPTYTLCTVGWLPQGLCIILNYYPMIYRKLIEIKDLPELELGELLMRAELKEGGVRRAGATIYLDKDGQVVIKDKDEKTTITMNAAGEVTIDADTKVTVNCSDVNLGGEAGDELATKNFVESIFDSHIHLSGVALIAPSGGGSCTGETGGATPTSNSSSYTSKTKAE